MESRTCLLSATLRISSMTLLGVVKLAAVDLGVIGNTWLDLTSLMCPTIFVTTSL